MTTIIDWIIILVIWAFWSTIWSNTPRPSLRLLWSFRHITSSRDRAGTMLLSTIRGTPGIRSNLSFQKFNCSTKCLWRRLIRLYSRNIKVWASEIYFDREWPDNLDDVFTNSWKSNVMKVLLQTHFIRLLKLFNRRGQCFKLSSVL